MLNDTTVARDTTLTIRVEAVSVEWLDTALDQILQPAAKETVLNALRTKPDTTQSVSIPGASWLQWTVTVEGNVSAADDFVSDN